MSEAIAASIIIPAKNESENIGACLEGILGQDVPEPFEVIVIDSGSTDGTKGIVKAFDVRLHEIRPDEFGHGRTRNLGARMAVGRCLVFVNADATPAASTWLRQLLAELEADDVAAVYGRQIPRPSAYPMERFFLEYLYGNQRLVKAKINQPLDSQDVFFSTVNCAIKRSMWERYPFNETIIMTEDQAWSRQILQTGYKIIYNPEAAVWHSHNYSLKRSFRRFFDSGWSSEDSYLQHGLRPMLAFTARCSDYLLREIIFLVRRGHWRWIPYAGLYEGSKLAGLILGRYHRLLPQDLRSRLSANYRAGGVSISGARASGSEVETTRDGTT
jgi:rhamnosyltransferase